MTWGRDPDQTGIYPRRFRGLAADANATNWPPSCRRVVNQVGYQPIPIRKANSSNKSGHLQCGSLSRTPSVSTPHVNIGVGSNNLAPSATEFDFWADLRSGPDT